MKLVSNTFKDKQIITDERLSAYGANNIPHLEWSEFPKETKSFALFMHDKDAPVASGFWHLQVVDINPNTTSIKEGVYQSVGFDRNNDTDQSGYFGPMPPQGHGLHEYKFTIYALPFENLGDFMNKNGVKHSKESSRAYAAFFIEMNALDKASISFLFEKK